MLSLHRWKTLMISILILVFALTMPVHAQNQSADTAQKLAGFDAFMEKTLKDWNAPGIGVGIVVNDKLVFAKGYGYRDYEKKLPITANTLFPIASNTKLFTAVAAGFLVEEGKLTWDRPIRESVPTIEFYDNALNNTVTLRDMLSHRTGITRHDTIWYKSDYTTKELFERLKYLEPKEPPRQLFLYNNMMYAGAGYSIEPQSGKRSRASSAGSTRGWWEVLNSPYRMGRSRVSWRGRLIAYHGRDLPGVRSQISFMPNEHVGAIVFLIGNHIAPLYNPISYNVYERLL